MLRRSLHEIEWHNATNITRATLTEITDLAWVVRAFGIFYLNTAEELNQMFSVRF
jgi:hypothetical protein